MESADGHRFVLEAWNEEWVPVAEGAGCDDGRRFETHQVCLPERQGSRLTSNHGARDPAQCSASTSR